MKNILAMVEGSGTSKITSFDQIDQTVFQELLAKSSVWDFYEISREEYMKKDDGEKKIQFLSFIIIWYKVKFHICFFFIVWVLCVTCRISLCSISFLINDEVFLFSMTVFSVSSSEYKFCSVFDALLANDLTSEVKLSSE